MNEKRLAVDPAKVDSDMPQVYQDLVAGMVGRCTKYDEDSDFYLTNLYATEELYGEKFEDMVEWFDEARGVGE